MFTSALNYAGYVDVRFETVDIFHNAINIDLLKYAYYLLPVKKLPCLCIVLRQIKHIDEGMGHNLLGDIWRHFGKRR